MPYNELVKHFSQMRGYLRAFYVYGFQPRAAFINPKVKGMAERNNDYIRKRVDSWLGSTMRFEKGRKDGDEPVFLSTDSRSVTRNPLYAAFHAKSFTDYDLLLHFVALWVLADDKPHRSSDINCAFVDTFNIVLDDRTVRAKLEEYAAFGLLTMQRHEDGSTSFTLVRNEVDLDAWADALAFYTEVAPVGVIGSYFPEKASPFVFRHRFLQGALDSEVLLQVLLACEEHRAVKLKMTWNQADKIVFPVRVYTSVQTGRQYLLGVSTTPDRAFQSIRLDHIDSVAIAREPEAEWQALTERTQENEAHLWGVSGAVHETPQHVEMHIHMEANEGYILRRLQRECRSGQVTQIDAQTVRFTADVWDAREMLPWIRSFIGRIAYLSCTDETLVQRLRDDMAAMAALYGEEVPPHA